MEISQGNFTPSKLSECVFKLFESFHTKCYTFIDLNQQYAILYYIVTFGALLELMIVMWGYL